MLMEIKIYRIAATNFATINITVKYLTYFHAILVTQLTVKYFSVMDCWCRNLAWRMCVTHFSVRSAFIISNLRI